MSSYTNILTGVNVQPSQSSYKAYTIAANLTLIWPLQFIDTPNVVANIMDISASVGGLSIFMPDATQAAPGNGGQFNNIGPNSVNIVKSDGSLITALAPNNAIQVYLTDNTTIPGTWRIIIPASVSAVTSISIASTSNNLTVTPATITSAGTFTFSLANDLLALSSFGAGTGIATRTAANTWSLRTIAGTANQISVTNGSGVVGNPTISLPAVITGVNDMTIGNINIAANTITTTNANGDMLISCNGTGITRLTNNVSIMQAHELQFKNSTNSGYVGFKGGNSALGATVIWTLPLVDGTNGQVISTNGLGTLNWTSVVAFAGTSTNNAIAKFNGTAGALQDSGVIISATNNVTGMNSLIVGNINIGNISANTIASNDANGAVIVAPNGTGLIQLIVAGASEIQNTGLITVRPVGGTQNPIRFYNSANTFYTGLRAGANVGNVTLNLPIADGGANALMKTDGAGQLGWTPAGAGKMVLISSQGAAASANISFGLNAGTFPVYNSYMLVLNNIVPVNDDDKLYITVSTDGGTTWAAANYDYNFTWSDSATPPTNVAASPGPGQARIIATINSANRGIPNVANTPYNGSLNIFNAGGAQYTSIFLNAIYQGNAGGGGALVTFMGGGTYQQAIAVNGIRFTMSTGNIASGTFTLYGINT